MPEGTLQEWWSGKCFLASSGVTVGSRNAQPFLLMDSWLSGPAIKRSTGHPLVSAQAMQPQRNALHCNCMPQLSRSAA